MTDSDDDLAIRLTTAIVATPGVQGIFPQSVVAAAVAAFVRADRPAATGIVTLDRAREHLDITARLAIDGSTPTALIAATVAATVRRDLHGDSFTLHLEIAHLV